MSTGRKVGEGAVETDERTSKQVLTSYRNSKLADIPAYLSKLSNKQQTELFRALNLTEKRAYANYMIKARKLKKINNYGRRIIRVDNRRFKS